jgi:hypothetical protein
MLLEPPLPSEAELEAQLEARAEDLYYAGAEQPIGLVLNLDAALEPYRQQARKLRGKVLAGLDPSSKVGAGGLTVRKPVRCTFRRCGMTSAANAR